MISLPKSYRRQRCDRNDFEEADWAMTWPKQKRSELAYRANKHFLSADMRRGWRGMLKRHVSGTSPRLSINVLLLRFN